MRYPVGRLFFAKTAFGVIALYVKSAVVSPFFGLKMLATSAKSYKTHFIRFVFDTTKLVPCFYGIVGHLKHFWLCWITFLLIFGPKLPLYIYIGNNVPGNNPAARFSSPFHEYA